MRDGSYSIDAEARGKLRVLKARLAKQCAALDARLTSPSVEAIIKDFAYKGSLIGRQRALAKLSRVIGTAAHYEGAQLTGASGYRRLVPPTATRAKHQFR